MTDALSAMFDDAAYSELIDEANKDDRAGEGNAIVLKITDDVWPSGDPRRKILFSLLFAGNAKADLTIGDIPSAEQVRAEKASWDSKKKKAIASAVSIAKQFAEHYGKNPRAVDGPTAVREGDQFRVKSVVTKRQPDGSGGFARIVSILSPTGNAPSTGGNNGPGF